MGYKTDYGSNYSNLNVKVTTKSQYENILTRWLRLCNKLRNYNSLKEKEPKVCL